MIQTATVKPENKGQLLILIQFITHPIEETKPTMQKPNLLIVGDSPTLCYLTWLFTTAENEYEVTNLGYSHESNEKGTYCMHTQGGVYEYRPEVIAANFVSNQTIESIVSTKFDIVFFDNNSSKIRRDSIPELNYVLNNDTILIVDATEDIWITGDIRLQFPNNVVITMCSDVELRKSTRDYNSHIVLNDNVTVNFGYIPLDSENTAKARKAYETAIKTYLTPMKAIFRQNEILSCCSFDVLPYLSSLKLVNQIWKGTIASVCLGTLSIIFKEKNVMMLSQLNIATYFLRGLYEEILTITKLMGVIGLPIINNDTSREFLQTCIILEYNRSITRNIGLSKLEASLISDLAARSRLYHDFHANYKLDAFNKMLHYLKISHRLHRETPFIISIYNLVNRMILNDLQTAEKQSLDAICEKRTNYESLVLPTNHANYTNKDRSDYPILNLVPLSKWLPQCSFNVNPIIYMSEIHATFKSDNNFDSDEYEIDSVDSSLKELVSGTEEYFFDAESNINNQFNSLKHLNFQNLHHKLSPRDKNNYSYQTQYMQGMGNNLVYPQDSNANFLSTNGSLRYHKNNSRDTVASTGIYERSKSCGTKTLHSFSAYNGSDKQEVTPPRPSSFHRSYRSNNISSASIGSNHSMPNLSSRPGLASNGNLPNSYSSYNGFNLSKHGSFHIPKPKQSFLHASIPITRKTSSEKLRQSHFNLLDMVQFDDFMDKTTSSRYGADLDTSSMILNSANNSRGSLKSVSRSSSNNWSPMNYHQKPLMSKQYGKCPSSQKSMEDLKYRSDT